MQQDTSERQKYRFRCLLWSSSALVPCVGLISASPTLDMIVSAGPHDNGVVSTGTTGMSSVSSRKKSGNCLSPRRLEPEDTVPLVTSSWAVLAGDTETAACAAGL